ncbi:RNA polymerase subunit sigma-70 [Sinorhizobium fredii]|uniref:RNA polymerase subunit sigma-70 n=1 Tax=Rhizobium fredii TaxID=380 RepID=A0A2A6M495_RHIFR|nr:hypothetical protein [Sinorhizobium fredii]PDT49209.1 RNA polymerase subunit sigma-70 [Sinorhizobium fredii]
MNKPQSTPGRPPHHPTVTSRRLVELLAAEAIPQPQICRVLKIDPKTLRRHYRAELDRGAAKVEAELVLHLYRLAGGKGAVALRAITFLLQARFGWSRYAPTRR